MTPSAPETDGGARLMIGFHGTEVGSDLERVLHDTGARGVILFARNVVDAAQTRALVAQIRATVPWPLVVAVDQEGGAVVRIARGATVFPGNMALGAADSVELAARQGEISGRELGAMGFDLNLAPVVDLQTQPKNPGIGIRSLGADLERAIPLAQALIEGHLRSGVRSCLKHFPGKGAALVDAHLELPVLSQSLEEFRHPHLAVFERLCTNALPLATMTSHVVVTGLDPDAPATLSPAVVSRLLRGEIGFDGLLLTDDLEMGAIVKHFGVAEAAERAIRAGHDMVLVCHDAGRQREAAARLREALATGRLDRAQHERALDRIAAFSATGRNQGADTPLSPDGADTAHEIARRAVHLFADRGRLLPLARSTDLAVVAVRPQSVVGVEEIARGAATWESVIDAHLRRVGLTPAEVFGLDVDSEPARDLVERCATHERTLLFSWDAHRSPHVKALLASACTVLRDRLVVVHLRNPFDQAFVPPEVTALTAFGYQSAQLAALCAALCGDLAPTGRLPAPLDTPLADRA